MRYLQNGIEVCYTDKGEERSAICYLVDYANTDNNSFIVANQWTFIENDEKRPDVLLFINGLPVVLMELKSPSREETDASEAYTQIRNYMHSIPSMFIYNAICVMSDLSENRAGTITSGEDRYMEWKTKDGSYENTQFAQFDTFFEGIFTKERLLDILKNFILLKQAMNDYTVRDKKNYGNTDIAKVAYPKFQEKLQVCRDLLHEYDYSAFFGGNELTAGRTITGAVNFLMDRKREKDRESYTKEALLLKQALSLCSSIAEEDEREEAAFFEAVRVLLMRILNQGGGKKLSLPEINAKINELLKQSIKSDGVINLFSDKEQDFSLFDPKFLEEISKMKEKNLAVELLKRLIAEQVHIYKRTNLVKSEKFSEIMQSAMNRYLNGMLTNEEVIQEMLNLAKQIREAQKAGEDLGLTADELAFYDALTKPQAIKDFYENEELIAITKELADTLRRNRTIDWQKRESARARMRMMIKKLLKSHRYPPEGMDDAVATVMQQCELWADNVMSV